MKRILLAAALCATSATVAAQQPTDVPPLKCEKPQMPGKRMMEDYKVQRGFESDVKKYKECVNAYVDERKSAISGHEKALRAHERAANSAIEEYNATVLSFNPEADKGSKSGPGTGAGAGSTEPKRGY